MKRMLIAAAIAQVLVTGDPALAWTNARSSKAQPSVAAERPQICFEFAFWKYCI